MAMDCGDFEGSSPESRGSSLGSRRLRAALAGGAAVALILAALGAADAAVQPKAPHAKLTKKEPPPKPLDMPLIEVSISKQQLTLFENGAPVAHAPVSTGMAGHPTPTGIFSVIGKEIFHRSNIYSGAPMPYMQRITWSGVALHAGVLPGYPASHGCIRMPHEFAVRLYGLTRLGARVLVLPHEVAPVPFENAKLFTRAMPATDKVSEAAPPADAKPGRVRTAESNAPVMSDATDAAAHAAAGPAVATQTPESPKGQPQAATTATTAGEPTTGTVVVKPVAVTSPQPIEVRKSFEPARGPREGTQTFEPPPAAPAAQPAQAAPAPAPEVKPAATATAAADELYGPERPMRPGPITVFVSRREGKLFVRKGFQPLFSWPVKIEHPELPLGTHLYTAVDANPDSTSYRWQVVSVPVDTARRAEKHVARDKKGRRIETAAQPAATAPAATAAEALERIDIPPVALTRISALMSKGASLIISDQGLGGETGTETDFIVLTR
jgi:L,D-transpeptidase catalytic domain